MQVNNHIDILNIKVITYKVQKITYNEQFLFIIIIFKINVNSKCLAEDAKFSFVI